MDEETKALLRQQIALQKQSIGLLEKIANRQGVLGKEHEDEIKECLMETGKVTKVEVQRILGVSPQAALNVMKRLALSSDVVYVPGIGKKSSYLVYVDGDTIDAKAVKLQENMQRGEKISLKEAMELLRVEKPAEVQNVITAANKLFQAEFRMANGEVIRYKV